MSILNLDHGPDGAPDELDVCVIRGFIHEKMAAVHRALIVREVAKLRAELERDIRAARGCSCSNCEED